MWIEFAQVVGGVFACAGLPGTLELFTLTAAGMLPAAGPGTDRRAAPESLAVVIPAHNEAEGIAACVASVLTCVAPPAALTVVVIADNCDDDTADRARAAGARVLERFNQTERGKGYALDFAFQTLMAEGVDAFVVVDADTRVSANLLTECHAFFAAGADAVQCRYEVNNPEGSIRTRLMRVALFGFNVLRPHGRDRLGFSAGISGNGFGLTAATLRAVPYTAHSVVEDLEYHLRLVTSGRRVRFVDRATVRADMPTGGRAVTTQRTRWEGGRFRMILETSPKLMLSIAKGKWRLIEPLGDLWLLPLAFHVALLAGALALGGVFVRLGAGAGVAVVGLHVLAAIRVGGGGWRDVGALFAAPWYVLWKILLIPKLFAAARKNTAWVRTERAGEGKR
jgi:cellulose synthase/poly-beta-1,6-N-acetylglucosamine synthase-like glycosyltransferase